MNKDKELSIFDSICIIVGIMLGSSIFMTLPIIIKGAGSIYGMIGIWILGALLSICGALVYTELATKYPKNGGDFIYLSEAFGSRIGSMFAWAHLTVIQPGSIASMIYLSSNFLKNFFTTLGIVLPFNEVTLSIVLIIILTFFSSFFRRPSQNFLNILTGFKVLSIIALSSLILFYFDSSSSRTYIQSATLSDFNLALIMVLFAYGGWNELVYVTAEVSDYKKNVLKSLMSGILLIGLLYILFSIASVLMLGVDKIVQSQSIARDMLTLAWPAQAGAIIDLLICISCLGATHALIFTGARVSAEFGKKCYQLKFLSVWSSTYHAPINAYFFQGLIALFVVVLVGSFTGAVVYTTGIVWFFSFLTGVSLFINRASKGDPSSFKVPLFPFTPLLFCLSCLYITHSALVYDLKGSLISLGIVLPGLLFKLKD